MASSYFIVGIGLVLWIFRFMDFPEYFRNCYVSLRARNARNARGLWWEELFYLSFVSLLMHPANQHIASLPGTEHIMHQSDPRSS